MTDRQKLIAEIKKKLQSQEISDYHYMTDKVKELRHFVMYVHSRLETSIDVRIMEHIEKGLTRPITYETERAVLWNNLVTILDEMDFSKKVKIARKYNRISGKLEGKLLAVNDIRVYFSHPSSYTNKLIGYEDEGKYLEAMEKLEQAMDAMNDLIKSEHPEWYPKG